MTPIETEIALSFFLRLLLGHFVGDFVLQPYWLVLAKREGWPGLIVHVGVVTFITAILVWGVIPNWWVWMMVLFGVHLFTDQFRTFVFTDNSKGKGLLLLLVDQLAHLISLAVIAGAATGWTPASLAYLFAPDVPNLYRVIVFLIGLAILVSTVPVLEVEFITAVRTAQGKEVTKPASIDREDRLLGSIERIIAAVLMLLGYVWLAPLAFIPRLALMIAKGQARDDRTAVTTKVLTSFTSTLVVSVLLGLITPPHLWL